MGVAYSWPLMNKSGIGKNGDFGGDWGGFGHDEGRLGRANVDGAFA
jgi:hypothetical protein